MDPLVTCVLLTTHPKRAAYLPDAVASYRAQTYPHKELLVVNDGEPLVSSASDIRVVNLPAKVDGRRWSIGEKRNVGIRLAHGDWLATWDDDDISLENRLADQVAYATAHGADVVFGDRLAVADETMTVVGTCSMLGFFVQASVLLSREMAVRSGGYSINDFAEDAELIIRAKALSRARSVTIPKTDWYVMRRHKTNITNEFGGSADSWVACARRDPQRMETQRRVDAIRALDVSRELAPAPPQLQARSL